MARTSKIALFVAGALAAGAILAGSAVAASSPLRSVPPGTTVPAGAVAATSSDDWIAERSNRRADRAWGGGGPGPERFDRQNAEGYWSTGELLQWIAIGLLAGSAVALVLWRPWRRGPQPVVSGVPVPSAPTPADSTRKTAVPPSGTAAAEGDLPRPRLWKRRSQQ